MNTSDELVEWKRESAGRLTALRVGTQTQPILGSSGDDHRIDWGYAYAAADGSQATAAIGESRVLAKSFADQGRLPAADDTRMPRPVKDAEPAMAFAFDLGAVEAKPVERQVLVAYDEIYAIKYFGTNLRPYWKRQNRTMEDLLQAAATEYPALSGRAEAFDKELAADLTTAGGSRYAQIAALAYRQVVAGCGLAADANGQPLYFTKENTSNGDIATVDVFFPMAPSGCCSAPRWPRLRRSAT